MSAALQESSKVNGATECNTCSGGAVRAAGQESVEPSGTTEKTEQQPVTENKDQVVVMQGPLGTAITEALQKSLSKKALQSSVQVPGVAMEDHASDYIQANGQINNSSGFITRISKAVGLVPATDETPTAVNTLLDCASKVEDIEFILVNKIESSPSESSVPQKSMIHEISLPGRPGLESLAIESVQVVVTYRKCVKNTP